MRDPVDEIKRMQMRPGQPHRTCSRQQPDAIIRTAVLLLQLLLKHDAVDSPLVEPFLGDRRKCRENCFLNLLFGLWIVLVEPLDAIRHDWTCQIVRIAAHRSKP